MDEKWLIVPKGQFTFNNEGNDIESSIFYSRKAHVPHNPSGVVIGQSGVTIGRGLDVGNIWKLRQSSLNLKRVIPKIWVDARPFKLVTERRRYKKKPPLNR